MFVVDEATLRQIFSEHFGFPCQSFQLFHTHHHPSSEAGTIVADIPSRLSLTPPQEKKHFGI
jgi:hypothetical protein